MRQALDVSERRACRVLRQHRSTQRKVPQGQPDKERLTADIIELARTYHHFYDACRVVDTESKDVSAARLALCEATRASLRTTLGLLGVSAPERM